ncbi:MULTISPECIES: M50 family metallopeptidase [unclassified Rhodococcus (in: high G+C Gram-positive bacteria)]|jgi:membrane-associated protease RseP (regulator of RpoE activity)|uniref:M50 family metallopeptidase n=1 Tax=unclassified Rhodococcus (in: high G+C Gram-positive bacteria) TaxID=192944 RepID=UPI001C9AE49B|nr:MULTISPECIES: M50 family metallopeptidase [unclassified Rhodococcus (in: high G+C Gram-positive bacteria)]MBY6679903.1 site-2 protease family protein [Rhodococcus sp. BP-316]MBY6685835.1 site-2 protease family protein [Rhodococcus sp. BP-288]MBY6694617.1 site-2 protease family protein [Rhodococcus sp. BP-188]MBY6699399.1 site-2 protease family protein [Rhodococcus sp. BP-285]MBY6703007.1 site-2 protease family protein [Rhodococcus sp. BP-283]
MVFVLGVIAFAICIGISIALHECGHMWVAKATGMKVRRYYIGFGPKIFSWRRGETEYGLKAIPAGGFCDIAGMTAVDELAPDEVERAMYKQKTWKRLAVMFGGIAMNFVLAFVLVYTLALGWGLPNRDTTATVAGTQCVAPQNVEGDMAPCSGPGPAGAAGIRDGDVITAVNGESTPTFGDVVAAIQDERGSVSVTVERAGETLTVPVDVQETDRLFAVENGAPDATELRTVGAIGVARTPLTLDYDAVSAIGGSASYTVFIAGQTVQAIVDLPSKVGALWTSITGGERDPNTPISVVGASVIGGQAAERGLWEVFVTLLATLNFFLGAFNLLPLLPLDGGHIAVTVYEGIRNKIRSLRGLGKGAPVNYLKLMPVTYVVILIGGAFMLLTLTADIVNPIQIFR